MHSSDPQVRALVQGYRQSADEDAKAAKVGAANRRAMVRQLVALLGDNASVAHALGISTQRVRRIVAEPDED